MSSAPHSAETTAFMSVSWPRMGADVNSEHIGG
eukprot:CAMPEP_0197894030 /NCGR_PEP_ID=MMETSP1439-20131203/34216_1 /TAXON_ID=66791 /ORGANISM="Gonyaulax spinifera, Strain CCMP409" /LENGTH=32 /DNA_ID= /DNA_START= /DNA_END= /DNA_ORIENTATION=